SGLGEVPAPRVGPRPAGPHRRLRAPREPDPPRAPRAAERRAALPAGRFGEAARLPAHRPRGRGRGGRGGGARPAPAGRRLAGAADRGARHRSRAPVPDARSAGRRPLSVARPAQLRRARSRRGAGARVPRAPPPAHRARLRLLPVTKGHGARSSPDRRARRSGGDAPRVRSTPRRGGLPSDPLWYKDAIFYEIRVGAFRDGDDDGIGDFQGLTDSLDYLQDLGVTTLWLLPFCRSPQRDD